MKQSPSLDLLHVLAFTLCYLHYTVPPGSITELSARALSLVSCHALMPKIIAQPKVTMMMLLQVLPQLLHYIGVDPEDPEGPDWGCIAVYSCPNSCSPPEIDDDQSSYIEEFAWVQPP